MKGNEVEQFPEQISAKIIEAMMTNCKNLYRL